MRTLITVGTAMVLTTLFLAFPVAAQEDRSSDPSFGFAGRAEYNQPLNGASSGSSDNGSSSGSRSSGSASSDPAPGEGFLPETGGFALVPALGVAGLFSGAVLIRRAARRGARG